MAFPFRESILTQRRSGKIDDPYISLSRNIMVKSGKVLLPEIPSFLDKVIVIGDSKTWIEIDSGAPTGTFYKVSYLHGYVEFDSIHDGKTLNFSFKGTGNVFLSSERSWYEVSGTSVTKTVKDKLDELDNVNSGQSSTNQSLQSQISTETLSRINADSAHINSSTAHSAQNISYSGNVTGNNVKTAIDNTNTRINTLVINGDSSPAAADAALGLDGVDHETLKDRLDYMEAKQLAAATASKSLNYGLNKIDVPDASPLALTVKGRTLVNLLGNSKDITKWSPNGAFSELSYDSDSKVYGDKGFKLKILSGTVATAFIELVGLDVSGYYLVMADVKNGDADNIKVYTDTGNTFGNVVSDTANFAPSYLKITGVTSATVHYYVNGEAGQYAYGDGFRFCRISAATYAKIDVDPEYTGDKLAAKYPYVDSVQHLDGFYAKTNGKNMLPPFTEWNLHANASVISPYQLRLTGAFEYQNSNITIDILPSQTYTFGCNIQTVGAYVYAAERDKNDIVTNGTLFITHPSLGDVVRTFTTSVNARKLEIHVLNDSTTGIFTFTNPQLELGSVATEFTPFNEDYIYVSTKLAGDEKTGVYDTYDTESHTVTRRFKTDVLLDGSLMTSGPTGWQFDTDETGVKRVKLLLTPSPYKSGFFGKGYLINEKGLPLTEEDTSGRHNTFFIYNDNCVYLRISDDNTGWGENWTGWDITSESGWGQGTVTAQTLIKAYFNGWKIDWEDGTFTSLVDGSVPSINTAAYCAANKATGYTPYKLNYQLEDTESEVITPEGSLSLVSGGNIVSIGSGVVVREPVTPETGYGGLYYINLADSISSLDNKSDRIIAVYKNDILDLRWSVHSRLPDDTNISKVGKTYAQIDADDYDPDAEYSCSYIAMDVYDMTTNPVDVVGRYQTTQKSIQDELVKKQADIATQVSIHTNQLIEILVRLKAAEI